MLARPRSSVGHRKIFTWAHRHLRPGVGFCVLAGVTHMQLVWLGASGWVAWLATMVALTKAQTAKPSLPCLSSLGEFSERLHRHLELGTRPGPGVLPGSPLGCREGWRSGNWPGGCANKGKVAHRPIGLHSRMRCWLLRLIPTSALRLPFYR